MSSKNSYLPKKPPSRISLNEAKLPSQAYITEQFLDIPSIFNDVEGRVISEGSIAEQDEDDDMTSSHDRRVKEIKDLFKVTNNEIYLQNRIDMRNKPKASITSENNGVTVNV
jgi:hypothetical protein